MKFFEDAYKINFEGISSDFYTFRFISVGENDITKIVSFSPIDKKDNWYNLGFGNLEKNEQGEWIVNDVAEKNNTDFSKVLSTVFNCIIYFLHLRPETSVLFFGNTTHKNELYKRKISSKHKILAEYLKILGGRVKNHIPLIEKEQVVVKRTKSITRTVYYKDIDSIIGDIETEFIHPFDPKEYQNYQFVLIEVK